ncbi:MAG: exodeoxyribonuclease III [Candidatus Omnitrophica bacterium]|nr:exodeoxyribonuclease III [Candidatus Omnitrophota bacterium]
MVKRTPLTVGTFNVNGIHARLPLCERLCADKNSGIDVLCLQEVKTESEKFPYDEFARWGYQSVCWGRRGRHGVALCSRVPIKDVRKGWGEEAEDEERRILSGMVRGYRVFSLYAPHGDREGSEKYFAKLEWYLQLLTYLTGHFRPSEKIVMMGDFNVARSDTDVYNARAGGNAVGTYPKEREVFNDLLNWGLHDLFREKYPRKKAFTWWDYYGDAWKKNRGMRIDYALGTAPVRDKLVRITVARAARARKSPKPSDHAPVIAQLR